MLQIILGIISAVTTISCAILGVVLLRKTERIKMMERQLSEKRYSAYAKLYDFFYEIFKVTKDGKRINDKDMRNKLIDAKKELIMYGSDDVVLALNSWLESLSGNSYNQLDKFLDLMLLVRKDMCGNSKINRSDILLNLMQDKKELEKFDAMKKQSINA